MKSIKHLIGIFTLSLLFTSALAQAVEVTGTVTNKTTGKPSAGDSVVLVDPMAGMSEVAHTTTDGRGHFSLERTGAGPALLRVTHQGVGYFIEAPKGGAPGDVSVYDVATKVNGVFLEADVMEIETSNDQLHVTERYFVHNTGTPPTTQWSAKSFEIVLPPDAMTAGAAAQRPGGLPTSLRLDPAGAKGHFYFNFPIQPDNAEKSTMFQVSYQLPYSSGKYTFKQEVTLPAQNLGVLIPKSMSFSSAPGSDFQNVPEDPGVQTFVARNAAPGKPLEFTVSGTGSIPRQQQASGPQMGGDSGGGVSDAAGGNGGKPGGGIGNPIDTPDPLSKYKWWILGGLALLLAAAAAFLLRRQSPLAAGAPAVGSQEPVLPPTRAAARNASVPLAAAPAPSSHGLLAILKDELFSLESEKASGTISAQEYAEVKTGLEAVLKRALKRSNS